jgi:tetratricopeptide (TPR) repeat protein
VNLFKTMLRITLCTLATLLVTEMVAQKDSSRVGLFDAALSTPRIMAARHEFNDNNMRGAMLIYREVLQSDANNAAALYGTSECYYNLKKYKLALEYLNKALEKEPSISSESDFFRGQIYHRTAKLDDAIAAFDTFLAKEKPSTYEYELATQYRLQCLYARDMMKKPVDVSIENMGNLINSRYDEYTPSISADGNTIVFTARRNDTKGGRMDEEGDYKYFEDIYYSNYDETTKEWSQSIAVEGELNTETYDAVLSIFPSGNGMYVYKNTVSSTGDIYFSEYRPGTKEWSAAQKMPRPINTSYFEGSISMTADGTTVYFVSERPEGEGQGDIYVATKKGESWTSPKNLGAVVNTDLDEKFVFIHPNGKTLFFASNGHQTMGSYDIFKTEYVNGEWSVPINLGYPINTVNEESTFSLTKDNKTLMIAAEYEDSFGERDIYKIDVSKYELLSGDYAKSTAGQILVSCTYKAGEPAKNVLIEAYYVSNNKLVTSAETDKSGRAKLNLPGNETYKIVTSIDDFKDEKVIDLSLRNDGETVIKHDVQITR